jgi:hypothetical protein
MVSVKTYERIFSELMHRRSKAASPTLRDALDRAIKGTERSRKCLETLFEQLAALLADLSTEPRLQNEIIDTAAAAIAANEEHVAMLCDELRLTLKTRESTRADDDLTVPEGTSPELRDLLMKLRHDIKAASESPWRTPDTIRQEIIRLRQHNQLVAETASTAIHLASASRSTLKAIYAASNLWLTHVLINQIYDTSNVEFEATLRNERRAEGLSWVVGQILGLVPLVGINLAFLDFVRKLAQLRSTRWANADATLAFLDSYEEALQAWSHQCKEHSARAATVVANLSA